MSQQVTKKQLWLQISPILFMLRTKKESDLLTDVKNLVMSSPPICPMVRVGVRREDTPPTPEVILAVPWDPVALSLCLAGKGKFKPNEAKSCTQSEMAGDILGSTGVFTHRMSGPLSIFAFGGGRGYNCSDLSLNWALKPTFAYKAPHFFP